LNTDQEQKRASSINHIEKGLLPQKRYGGEKQGRAIRNVTTHGRNKSVVEADQHGVG